MPYSRIDNLKFAKIESSNDPRSSYLQLGQHYSHLNQLLASQCRLIHTTRSFFRNENHNTEGKSCLTSKLDILTRKLKLREDPAKSAFNINSVSFSLQQIAAAHESDPDRSIRTSETFSTSMCGESSFGRQQKHQILRSSRCVVCGTLFHCWRKNQTRRQLVD